jgi:hypothetical protein
METYQPRYDLNCWNLDALEFWQASNASGKILIHKINDDLGYVKRVAIMANQYLDKSSQILLLRPEARVIQSIDSNSTNAKNHHIWKRNEEFFDITTNADFLYVLARQDANYFIIRYRVSIDRLLPLERWMIDSPLLTSSSRIYVTTLSKESITAHIGPCKDNQFLIVELNNPTSIRELRVDLVDEKIPLGQDLDFYLDSLKDTLVIADTQHHRIIEADCKTGKADIICGAGQPGNALEEAVARRAPLHSPRGVAVYRPKELIEPHLLNTQSKTFLNSDERTRPRTILIADSGNFRIKKLVELPFIASEQLSLSDEPFIYTLIGSGKEVRGNPPKFTEAHKTDLRQYPISEPSALSISKSGEVLIYCRSNQTLLLLKPSTAMSPVLVRRESQQTDIDTTDPGQ